MNKPYCYRVYLGYEEFKITPVLKDAILELVNKGVRPSHFVDSNNLGITAYFNNKTEKKIKSIPFIKKILLTQDDLLKIDADIEDEIKKTEAYLKTFTHTVTGYFGITRSQKEWAYTNEIKHRSYKWKNLDEIDWDNLGDIYIEKE